MDHRKELVKPTSVLAHTNGANLVLFTIRCWKKSLGGPTLHSCALDVDAQEKDLNEMRTTEL